VRRGLIAAGLVVALGAGAHVARARLDALSAAPPSGRPLLYLPNGRHLKAASLGHAPLVADVVYLWAIQFYSDYEREDRFRYVEHIFGRVIPELDPRYTDPYWIGALILTVEGRDLEGGLRVLETGFRNDPGQWVLLYLAGWECSNAGRPDRAAEYFGRAAAVPGAPAQLRRLQAGMSAKAGDLDEALATWRELRDDPASDATTREIAGRQVRDLAVKVDVRALERAVAAFRERAGRSPRGLEELVARGVLSGLPLDPDGRPYAYDPATGVVSSAAGRILGDR
jgi:tetratricopeptide (TPR) repeat protein